MIPYVVPTTEGDETQIQELTRLDSMHRKFMYVMCCHVGDDRMHVPIHGVIGLN